ncbi:hypothetical protein BMS97_01490 [Leuconostoc mesenteroides subsp. mesenteroides]|uniref:hypothetical protein n=1 Tax=Leuconostoc mesenteroides TaxID=1245 RepID=UPI000A05F412|nr:hypothetical protein [Leuconostoc mesenteroides]ARN64079.1 hypothetical protein A0F18_08530 [Leuconostoc mesenteroides subsp. mesenteroides]MDV8927590.1 hypothetical protein [Leuconostoc mesenteroides]ORI91364.1 hypothetical protein BMS97_01490 [Leuconostoc mesenteroides subsp. mesenteroides]ORI92277.1 hypothetical protein BMS98_05840 [Leuconostoc mesenteroides subsp. mesenteroides]
MNMTVGDLQFNFVDGKLTLKYASVSFNAGTFPNSLNGNLQVTPEDGVSITSTEDDIKTAAKTKIQALIAEAPAENAE